VAGGRSRRERCSGPNGSATCSWSARSDRRNRPRRSAHPTNLQARAGHERLPWASRERERRPHPPRSGGPIRHGSSVAAAATHVEYKDPLYVFWLSASRPRGGVASIGIEGSGENRPSAKNRRRPRLAPSRFHADGARSVSPPVRHRVVRRRAQSASRRPGDWRCSRVMGQIDPLNASTASGARLRTCRNPPVAQSPARSMAIAGADGGSPARLTPGTHPAVAGDHSGT